MYASNEGKRGGEPGIHYAVLVAKNWFQHNPDGLIVLASLSAVGHPALYSYPPFPEVFSVPTAAPHSNNYVSKIDVYIVKTHYG